MSSPAGHDLFWKHAEPFLARDGCTRSTMMGFPCLRRDGAYFASVHKDGSSMIVKLPRARVAELVAAGDALPFAPNGRVFMEWAAVPTDLAPSWPTHLEAAWTFAAPA